jgi:hypothetical protein
MPLGAAAASNYDLIGLHKFKFANAVYVLSKLSGERFLWLSGELNRGMGLSV